MKRVMSLVLFVVLLLTMFVGTPVQAQNEDYDTDLTYESNPEVTSNLDEIKEKISELQRRGYIGDESSLNEINLPGQQQASYDNVELLAETYVLVGLDTDTYKTIDIDQLILDNGPADTEKPLNLVFYTLKITDFIGNPNTTEADFVHSAAVTSALGCCSFPKDYTINSSVYQSTDGTIYAEFAKKIETVKIREDVNIVTRINTTFYWKSDATAYANFKDASNLAASGTEGPFLLNKKGVKYPEYTDNNSKLVLTKPASTTWTKGNIGCGLTPTERIKYRDYYDTSYGSITWVDNLGRVKYEIHHIRPCNYGGTNIYDNLIPLPYDFHRKVVTPWWSSY
ncbi:HNH endonuclease [Paenibacillus sp. MER TA 81-3]|uniref:HNH endonuclease signature motif containing protein n=1 Tax=Paenibacillus sp. MER TA 81-3 TaxID=2939573 RepID=UPI002041D8F3|nr:HNH endonuclease signature motif containing protein [Paenibacillus sp. MER TA 81-3]MCM3341034.1 HNH endonuclease [Paenibacillus sp. MER TA 81-3]